MRLCLGSKKFIVVSIVKSDTTRPCWNRSPTACLLHNTLRGYCWVNCRVEPSVFYLVRLLWEQFWVAKIISIVISSLLGAGKLGWSCALLFFCYFLTMPLQGNGKESVGSQGTEKFGETLLGKGVRFSHIRWVAIHIQFSLLCVPQVVAEAAAEE